MFYFVISNFNVIDLYFPELSKLRPIFPVGLICRVEDFLKFSEKSKKAYLSYL